MPTDGGERPERPERGEYAMGLHPHDLTIAGAVERREPSRDRTMPDDMTLAQAAERCGAMRAEVRDVSYHEEPKLDAAALALAARTLRAVAWLAAQDSGLVTHRYHDRVWELYDAKGYVLGFAPSWLDAIEAAMRQGGSSE